MLIIQHYSSCKRHKLHQQLLNFIHSHHKIADQVPAYAFKDVYSGVMTIANIAPIKSIGFKEKEPLIRIPKSALVTQYQILDHKRTLLVANIHEWGACLLNFPKHTKQHYLKVCRSLLFLL